MKNYKLIVLFLLLFFGLTILQSTIIQFIEIEGITPFLPIFVIIYISIMFNRNFGMFISFLLGLFFDLLTASNLGITSLGFVLISFFGFSLKKHIQTDNLPARLTIIVSILLFIFFVTTQFFSINYTISFGMFLLNVLFSTIYTLLIFLPFLFYEINFYIKDNE